MRPEAESADAEPTPSPDPLRLDRCPECGYLLTGLPAEGICPECGVHYDPSIVMLWGWARGLRARGVNTQYMIGGWLNAHSWFLFMIFTLLTASISSMGLTRYVPAWSIGGVAVATAVAVSIRRRRRLLADVPAPVQLRIVPEGFGQRDGIGPVELQRWGGRRRLHVRYRRNGYCRIRSYRWFSWGAGPDVVDFDWPCDQDAARRLCQRVAALHDAAQQYRKIHRLCRKNRLTQAEAAQQVARIRQQMQQQGFWRRGQAHG